MFSIQLALIIISLVFTVLFAIEYFKATFFSLTYALLGLFSLNVFFFSCLWLYFVNHSGDFSSLCNVISNYF